MCSLLIAAHTEVSSPFGLLNRELIDPGLENKSRRSLPSKNDNSVEELLYRNKQLMIRWPLDVQPLSGKTLRNPLLFEGDWQEARQQQGQTRRLRRKRDAGRKTQLVSEGER
ncbi:unnamed protein product [Pleuronectes platessa]|uniref:Uncharacterized protein n=1 Tax=Pleuronectes platessa TaxID=8262 RepID=A0A9N7U0M5_PLEPL|nr:unnamed protein product [Pleuronectes platessa]